jgi:two-component system, NarL family, sensor kinase
VQVAVQLEAAPISNFSVKSIVSTLVKHAEATQVEVELTTIEKGYNLTITDNGKGFDVNKISKSGNGLRNFEERMKEIQGKVIFDRHLGKGTSLILQFPYDITAI